MITIWGACAYIPCVLGGLGLLHSYKNNSATVAWKNIICIICNAYTKHKNMYTKCNMLYIQFLMIVNAVLYCLIQICILCLWLLCNRWCLLLCFSLCLKYWYIKHVSLSSKQLWNEEQYKWLGVFFILLLNDNYLCYPSNFQRPTMFNTAHVRLLLFYTFLV